MALLRRYGLYTAVAALFLYFFYSFSFSYDPSASRIDVPAEHQDAAARPPAEHETKPSKPSHDAPKNSHDDRIVWSSVALKHPVTSLTPLPTGAPKKLPKVQAQFKAEDETARNIRQSRRDEVKKAFWRGWKSYKDKAWLHDELAPVSGGHADPFGGWAATLIDALDSLWIMGFRDEFRSALKDVEAIDFGRTRLDTVNVFETNIRHLGGLLAAYELSGEKVLLAKATEVGDMLYHAFDTPNHMPVTRWNPHKAAQGEAQFADEQVLLAEIGSMTMEFTRLSQLTGDAKWFDAVDRITRVLEQSQDLTSLPGMWPIVVNARKPDFTRDTGFTIGAMADSTYEYLPKMHAMLGGIDPVYEKLYNKSMTTAIKHTMYRPMVPDNLDMLASGFVRAQSADSMSLNPELQHLGCYAGGMLALGGKLFADKSHVDIGKKLTDTCVWAYKSSPAGIMPEVSHLYACPFSSPLSPDVSAKTSSSTTKSVCKWNATTWESAVSLLASESQSQPGSAAQLNIASLRLPEGFTAIDDRRYILRPEAIESVFVMFRVSGEQYWRARAWDMWSAIDGATRTEYGNAAIEDVGDKGGRKVDSMESFWLAETLKYFYLIFDDPDNVSLDDWVFNTEAHPFRIMKPDTGIKATSGEDKVAQRNGTAV